VLHFCGAAPHNNSQYRDHEDSDDGGSYHTQQMLWMQKPVVYPD